MIFLSQILGTSIYDSQDEKIGFIHDVFVKIEDTHPIVIGLEVLSQGKKVYINFKDIEVFGEKLSTLKCSKAKIEQLYPAKNDLFLAKDLLERQIVDIDGAKLVRVNDIQLGKVGLNFCLISLAVGHKSFLKRLGIGFLASIFNIKDKFIAWDDFNLVDISSKSSPTLKLKMIGKELPQLHPADIANIIEELNNQQSKQVIEAISNFSDEFAADILQEIDEPKKLKKIVMDMAADKAADIVEEMDPDEAADLIADLPDEKAQELLSLMEDDESEDVEELLLYKDDTAGGIMNSDFVAVSEDFNVKQAIEHIKKVSSEFDSIYYVYIVDEKGILKGVVSLRTLIIESNVKKVKNIMTKNMITVQPDDDHQEVLKKMTKYDLFSISVVDKKGKLLGIVTVDDALRLLVPEA